MRGLFSALIPAKGDRADPHRRTYLDGAVVEYGSVVHRLRAALPAGGINVVPAQPPGNRSVR